jgi:hypothetical protein
VRQFDRQPGLPHAGRADDQPHGRVLASSAPGQQLAEFLAAAHEARHLPVRVKQADQAELRHAEIFA